MIALEPITSQNAILFKQVRLRALQDAPTAFRATYADESKLTDNDWIKRAAQWNGENSVAYLAMDSGNPCGIVSGASAANDTSVVSLFSMWVSPSHRRAGVGRMLVDAVIEWTSSRNAKTIQLTVTSNNAAAISFYQRLGFTMTGRTEPYRNDPTLLDCEMALTLL
jgi:ribosomal protein S18 acetylase RimI-like enzyme